MQPTAQKWTCDRCGVTASRLDGESAIQPSSWTDSEAGRFCLLCQRTNAGEAALERAPTGASRDESQQLRRTGLIEFEMQRLPDQRDGVIASACGTSPATVAAVRRTLDAADSPGE